jgi:L-seryl-tRNA(Ser) seleniumtransferase
VIAVTSGQHKTSTLEESLRRTEPPVICRIKDDRIILDMRTVRDEEVDLIAGVFHSIAASGAGEAGEEETP